MFATNWEVLDRTGFETCRGQILVAVIVVYLTMLNLWLWVVRGDEVNRHDLPFVRHATNEYEG